jgi:deazaflavin-dependent oxidoreductase (nitroreductase family)
VFWRFFNQSVKGHVAVFRLTRGRIGGRMVGGPILLLHHTGAKSGKKRISPLLYLPDGERMVIVASKGGYTKHPGWFHNLKANADTAVELQREGKVAVRARQASAEEREELWPRVVDLYQGYATYQRSTSREIPLVILDRR